MSAAERAAGAAHALARVFQLRMAGVPFDVLDALATPRAVALARAAADAQDALERASAAALRALRRSGLPQRRRDRIARDVGLRRPLRTGADLAPELAAYAEAATALGEERRRHAEAVREELDAAAGALRSAARRFLAEYAVFASASVEHLVFGGSAGEEDAPARDGRRGGGAPRWDRHRDRTLLMYLQRLATKNETFSAYGPSGWGRIDPAARGLEIAPAPGLRREVTLERMVADAAVAAMNRDPAVRAEIAPRLHPSARIDDRGIVRLDTGARVPLDEAARALVARCDGAAPAHALGDLEGLAALAGAGALVWEVQCPAFVADRVAALRDRVRTWRDGEARRRWGEALAALADLPAAFAAHATPAGRREAMGRARAAVAELRGAHAAPQRVLYRGANPILEECARDCGLVLGEALADEVTRDAAPWLELWRDTVSFVAHRVNEKLRALHRSCAAPGAAVPLPAFLRAAEVAGLPLATSGLPALGFLAFLEVKAAFRDAMAGRPDAPAWRLSAGDCAFLRRRFAFPALEAFTWPSADLQLAARTLEDVAAGRHRWVLAELHHPAVTLQHGVAWACPDPAAFAEAVRAVAGGPFCDWGFAAADLTSHTRLHLEAASDRWTYAGPLALGPGWRAVRPADAEVAACDDGDVRVRADGRDLGSFARSWIPSFGFHPFLLGLGAHTPRIELGRVVVQRESWSVGRADLPRAPYAEGAPELVRDVDRLRRARGIPRHVYVRPTDDAVRRLGAGHRDKDVKPVYVDLESYPFLDVLARWMAKHGELEVTEMLPGPDELPWREADGRRTFELRTLIVPRR
ncbi:MAG TPA: hypothetical protein VFL83_19915 [Anaeromyxobacter sp.]|nr:hypothetical protein [Anaeromyxobacter sp.]